MCVFRTLLHIEWSMLLFQILQTSGNFAWYRFVGLKLIEELTEIEKQNKMSLMHLMYSGIIILF